MLVLGRSNDQWIDILDSERKVVLSICIVQVRGNDVRLGFEAPPEMKIVRRELLEAEGK